MMIVLIAVADPNRGPRTAENSIIQGRRAMEAESMVIKYLNDTKDNEANACHHDQSQSIVATDCGKFG